MFDTPHKTAIKRSKLSVPMRYLSDHGLLNGRVLDYGCGRGDDAAALDIESYDPTWQPSKPRGKFDTITCNYVLNVVAPKTEREIIKDIRSRLRKNGIGYVTVRSDVKVDTDSQRDVHLKGSGIERVKGVRGCRMYKVTA